MITRKMIFIGFIFYCACACTSMKTMVIDGRTVNVDLNESYRNSTESIIGILNEEEYKEYKNLIEEALDTEIEQEKSILINYNQAGSNCLLAGLAGSDNDMISAVADNGKRLSNRICENYNAVDFFVFSKDAFFKKIYESKEYYQEDSDYFKNSIFIREKNCSAFFILKPNGEFIVKYGIDYFTEVEKFFNSRLVIQKDEK